MSWETFEENERAILAAIDVLMDNPKSRKRFRLLAVHEMNTDELLAEVFATSHGPVVAYHGAGITSDGRDDAFRQGRGRNNLVVAPLTATDDDIIGRVFSRSSSTHLLTLRDLVPALAEGRRKIVVG